MLAQLNGTCTLVLVIPTHTATGGAVATAAAVLFLNSLPRLRDLRCVAMKGGGTPAAAPSSSTGTPSPKRSLPPVDAPPLLPMALTPSLPLAALLSSAPTLPEELSRTS